MHFLDFPGPINLTNPMHGHQNIQMDWNSNNRYWTHYIEIEGELGGERKQRLITNNVKENR